MSEPDPLKPTVDAIAAPYTADGRIVGVSIGLICNGKQTTYHYGRTETDGPLPDEHTHYEIGSITKTMTGLLLTDGIVNRCYEFDTPVGELVPEAMGLGDRVTLGSMSTHTSGLPRLPANLFPLDPADPYAKYDDAHVISWLAAPHLDYEPGTQAVYSNLAVGLLGYALARDADTDYATLLRKRVLVPLDMDETGLELTAEQRAAMAKPHRADAQPDHLWNLNALAGAGGVRSTTYDMLKYLAAQLQPSTTRLGRAIELSQARQAGQDGPEIAKDTTMTLGWFFKNDTQWFGHNGQTGGYCAEMWFNQDKQIGVIVLSNTSSSQATELASELRQALERLHERS